MLERVAKIGLAFIAASLATGVAASVFSTQFVIAGLGAIDVHVPFGTRLSMTVTDLRMLLILVPSAMACFLPAFVVAAVLSKHVGGSRDAWFVLAGGVALVVELMIIEASLSLMPIAGARTAAGLALQGVAGALGGYVFARLTTARSAAEAS